MSSGNSALQASGAIDIVSADGGSTGVSGSVALRTGAATGANSGSLTLATGSSTGGAGGSNISAGAGDTGTGGALSLTAGTVLMRAVQVAEWACKPGLPAVTLSFAVAGANGDSGSVTLRVGKSTGSSAAGDLMFVGGSSAARAGDVRISAGSGGDEAGGAVMVAGGASDTGVGGSLPCRAVVAPVCLVVRSQSHPLMVAPVAVVVTFPLLLGRLRLARADLSRYVLVIHL